MYADRHAPPPSRLLDAGRWVALAAAAVLWWVVYVRLPAFADWAVARLPLDPASRMGEAIRFFVYDTPKVLMLLALVVFAMGVVRSFFSPERTRALLAGRGRFGGNAMAAALGVVTPFCSCSAVPLFLGFVGAGVPLGVTFSFLIAAPMVNEVALGLLVALLGWKVAATYLAFGLGVAMAAGWVIGRLGLEHQLEDWVRALRAGTAEVEPERLDSSARLRAGVEAVRDIVGKVWPWVVGGIAAGALIHGYVPADLMASIMGRDAWWSVPAAVLLGIPMYTNAAGIVPVVEALLGKGAAAGHHARLHDVGDCPLPAGDDHPPQGPEAAPDHRLRRRGRQRHPGRGLPVQRAVRLAAPPARKSCRGKGQEA